MGKVTQLIFGVLSPGNMNINLMSANITAGAATSAADLLTDLKSGYLLGANPRKQFLAQFAGIFVGTVVTVLCFRRPGARRLRARLRPFPAPAAQTWRAVADRLEQGLESLGPVKIWSIVIGGLVGIVLPLLSKALSQATRNGFLRPPALAWPGPSNGTTACCSSSARSLGYGYARMSPKKAEEYTFPVASGIIAGGSLMGVV